MLCWAIGLLEPSISIYTATNLLYELRPPKAEARVDDTPYPRLGPALGAGMVEGEGGSGAPMSERQRERGAVEI
jgi:hypothetical protein